MGVMGGMGGLGWLGAWEEWVLWEGWGLQPVKAPQACLPRANANKKEGCARPGSHRAALFHL